MRRIIGSLLLGLGGCMRRSSRFGIVLGLSALSFVGCGGIDFQRYPDDVSVPVLPEIRRAEAVPNVTVIASLHAADPVPVYAVALDSTRSLVRCPGVAYTFRVIEVCESKDLDLSVFTVLVRSDTRAFHWLKPEEMVGAKVFVHLYEEDGRFAS